MWKSTLTTIIALAATTTGLNARHHLPDPIDVAIGGLVTTGVVLNEIFDGNASINVHLTSNRYDQHRNNHNDGYRSYNRRSHREYRNDHKRHDSWKNYHSDYRDYNRHYDSHRNRSHSDGYYAYKNKKVWTNGHWDYIRNRYGRSVKIWVDGQYEWRKIRVWIPSRGRGDRYCN